MKKLSLSLILLLLSCVINGQLIVTQTTPAQALATLLGGGVVVSNITFNGDPTQIGTFDGSLSNIGLADGVIISSGDINVAVGPDNDDGATLPMGGFNNPGDADLTAIFGGTFETADAAILEFDFVPTGDTIQFNYVFASEEYNEYVCGTVNDVFGFFLSGPNPLGGNYTSQNLAIVPGTASTPVSINTVNNGAAGMFGMAANCDNIDPNWATYNGFYVDNDAPPGATVQFDGFTVTLSASAYVTCGQTYHIKFAVADGGDGFPDAVFDSGVFLQAGSFSSNTLELSSNIDVGGGDSILYEGCGSALLDFVRSDATNAATYNYSIVGGSANATDYTISADSVVFLPGQDTVTLTFDAIQDGLIEPLETVTIQLIQTICSVADTQEVTFYISDFPEPILTMQDTFIACGSLDSVPIWVDVVGPPYTVLWSTGQNTDTIMVYPNLTTTYGATISDTCGVYSVVDSATVTIVPSAPIDLTISSDSTKYCPQDSIPIFVEPAGGGGSFTYFWSPGGSTDSSFFVNPIVTTTYVVTVTDNCGTVKEDSVEIIVPNFVPLAADVTNLDDTICMNDLVVLNSTVNGGVNPYYNWNHGLGSASPVNVNPTTSTIYVLTAQDSCGAIAKDSVVITINPSNFQINLPETLALNCLNEIVVLDPAVTGGDGSETYIWSTGETTPVIAVSPLDTTTYILTVTGSAGCSSLTDSVTVEVPKFLPLGISVNNNTLLNCPGDPLTLIATVTGGSSSNLVVNWTNGVDSFTGNNIVVNPLLNTVYTAWVVDSCANDFDSASFAVNLPNYSPLSFDLFSGDTLVCAGDGAVLEVAASGGNNLEPYNYLWTNGSTSPTIQVVPLSTKSYSVSVTDACGLSIDTSLIVSVSAPTADFSHEYQGGNTVQFTDLSHTNIVAYQWTFDNGISAEQDPLHAFNYDGIHEVWLLVKDTNDCRDSILKTITPPMFVYAPNSFTPDGNGVNDVFKFEGVGIKEFKALIYNSWGELIFQTENIGNSWNGAYKGGKLPTGVYVYKLRAVSYENIEYEKTGKVSLLK